MAVYKVSVPFEPLTYVTLSSSSTSQLPDSFDLPGIRVTVSVEGIYNAELQVKAPGISVAKATAVERVEELLALLATWNDGFRISFRGVTAEQIPGEEVASVSVDEGETRHITAREVMNFQEFASLVRERGNVECEANALQWREQWSDQLRTALKLNYLAVVSHDLEPAFISQYSALEVLTAAIQGNPPSVLAQLEPKAKRQLISKIEETFRASGLSDNDVKRLSSRLRGTQTISNVDRITEALRICGISADREDVQLVVRQRAAVVHAGHSSDTNKLYKATSLVRDWVQKGLRDIVRTRQGLSPNTV